jgi:hypothetical protein
VGCANPIVAEEALVSGWWPSGLGEEAAEPLLASASGDRNGEAGLCYERMELEFGPDPSGELPIRSIREAGTLEALATAGREIGRGD